MPFKIDSFLFGDAGWCPNNPRFPLLVYRAVSEAKPGEDLARWFEATFGDHGWPPAWRYTVYDFAHYHSTSHEVIGVFLGEARIRFGDSAGQELQVRAGDVVLIPAGVSHELISSSEDFTGVGAYPRGYRADMHTKDKNDRPAVDARIEQLALPAEDPVTGGPGPLHEHWKVT